MITVEANEPNRLKSPGPYIGKVMNNLDTTCMGRLDVWIPEISHKPEEIISGWITVSYATPFYGVTNLKSSTDANAANTSQSYGMWFVPPDVGIEVMVMFVDNDPIRGYWFACIPHQLMNHMIPGIAARNATTALAADTQPITEYNKNKVDTFTRQSYIYSDPSKAPAHSYQSAVLERQGLLNDESRGTTTSSVRRESPPQVFGISTPGQATSRESYTDANFLKVNARTGGHQFVMDDGDAFGQNQLVRIRSTNGGSVLINDTIGSVYVVNQNGTSWVELTANGRIDVYGQGSINVHSEADINMIADNDINMSAGNSFNLVAKKIATEAQEQRHYGKSKFYAKSPDLFLQATTMTLVAKKDMGGGTATKTPGFALQAETGTMQFNKDFKTIAGSDITFESSIGFQVKGDALITLKTAGKLELEAIGGIYETAPNAGSIDSLVTALALDIATPDTGGYSILPTNTTNYKNIFTNWFVGVSTPITPLTKSDQILDIVDIQKPFANKKAQTHVPITPQHEPWFGHEFTASSSVPKTPPGVGTNEGLFANGSGVAFPDDTTGVVAGGKSYATNATLDAMIKDMNINFDVYKENFAATASRGKYDVVNSNGFVGRYQFSMDTLQKLGVTTSGSQSSVNSPSSWTSSTKEILLPGKNKAIFSVPNTPQLGPGTLAGFLLDTPLQDKCLIVATHANYLKLKSLGIITGGETAGERAGWLKVMAFMGLGDNQTINKLIPGMSLTPEVARKLTTNDTVPGNGAVGLFTHWKIQGNSPLDYNFADKTGATAYTYYLQAARIQTG